MTIELYGIARLRAGIGSIDVSAQTLGEALERLAVIVPKLSNSVLLGDVVNPAYKISLNSERFISDPNTILESNDHLLIISADVGG